MTNGTYSEVFKAEIYKRLLSIYQDAKSGLNVDKRKHRLEGFMHAGEFMGLMTHQQGRALLEKAHQEIFGESIGERKLRKEELRRAIEQDDEAFFETPAILRAKRSG